MKLGDVWEDVEFLQRSLEFAPNKELRVKFASTIKRARQSIEEDVVRNYVDGVLSEEVLRSITGGIITKLPRRSDYQYHASTSIENEFTAFARKAFKDMGSQ